MLHIDGFSCRSVYSRFNFQSNECIFFKLYEETRREDGYLLPVTLLPHQTPLGCVQITRTGIHARASACASPLMWTFSRVRARAQGPDIRRRPKLKWLGTEVVFLTVARQGALWF